MDLNKHNAMMTALQKLCKWRMVFAGWQMGTRANDDEASKALRDHREVTMLLRVEMSAFAALAIRQGFFTEDQWNDQLLIEARQLDAAYEHKFPGIKTSDIGVVITMPQASETMKNWPL